MTRPTFRTSVFALCLALVPAVGISQAPRFGPRHPPPPFQLVLDQAESLGLAPETAAEMRGLVDATREERSRLRGELETARVRLQELLDTETPDVDAVLAQLDVLGAAETELRKLDVQLLIELRALLTPEQRAALLDVMSRNPPPEQ